MSNLVDKQFTLVEESIKTILKKEKKCKSNPEFTSFFLTLSYFNMLCDVFTNENKEDLKEKENEIDKMVDTFLSS